MPNDPDNKAISAIVGERGIKSTADFADFMAGLMADLVAGRISPQVAAAACKAGTAMLQVAKLQMEYAGRDGNESLRIGGEDQKRLTK